MPADAADFKGLALVKVRSKRVRLEMHQVVVVRGDQAVFVALDDFGGVPFVVEFKDGRLRFKTAAGNTTARGEKLKTVLSLPLTAADFLGILRHEPPAGFKAVTEGDQEIWIRDGKKMRAVFSEFVARDRATAYPQRILIENGNYFLEIRWQNRQSL
jgi:hypothetical protein